MWNGGEAEDFTEPDTTDRPVTKRTEDFLAFVAEQVAARTAEQEATIRRIVSTGPDTGDARGVR
ncbi:hypothetical protein [Microbacterium lacticum]